jgi:hypothetical protein
MALDDPGRRQQLGEKKEVGFDLRKETVKQ